MDFFNEELLDESFQKDISSSEEIEFLTPMDVAKLMHCSIPTARQFFYRPDFPTIKVGKNLKVMKSAFVQWASRKRMD